MSEEPEVHSPKLALRRRPGLLPRLEAALGGRGPRPLLEKVRPGRVPVPERTVRPQALLLRRRRRLRRQGLPFILHHEFKLENRTVHCLGTVSRLCCVRPAPQP